jgi:hypothetical protein
VADSRGHICARAGAVMEVTRKLLIVEMDSDKEWNGNYIHDYLD